MPTKFQCLSYATTYPVQIPRTDLQLRVHTLTLRFSLTLRYSRLSGPVVHSGNKQVRNHVKQVQCARWLTQLLNE